MVCRDFQTPSLTLGDLMIVLEEHSRSQGKFDKSKVHIRTRNIMKVPPCTNSAQLEHHTLQRNSQVFSKKTALWKPRHEPQHALFPSVDDDRRFWSPEDTCIAGLQGQC